MSLTYDQATNVKATVNMALAEAGHEQTASLIDIGGGWYSVGVPPIPAGIKAAGMAALHVLGPDASMRCSWHARRDNWNGVRPQPCTTARQMFNDPTFDCRLAPSAAVVLGSLGVPTGAGAGIGRKR